MDFLDIKPAYYFYHTGCTTSDLMTIIPEAREERKKKKR